MSEVMVPVECLTQPGEESRGHPGVGVTNADSCLYSIVKL